MLLRGSWAQLTWAVWRVLILAAVVYIVTLMTQAVYRNWKINQRIANLEADIALLEWEKEHLNLLVVWYNSRTYKELQARARLNMKKPGEQVLIVHTESAGQTRPRPSKKKETPTGPSNPALWWQYLFGQ